MIKIISGFILIYFLFSTSYAFSYDKNCSTKIKSSFYYKISTDEKSSILEIGNSFLNKIRSYNDDRQTKIIKSLIKKLEKVSKNQKKIKNKFIIKIINDLLKCELKKIENRNSFKIEDIISNTIKETIKEDEDSSTTENNNQIKEDKDSSTTENNNQIKEDKDSSTTENNNQIKEDKDSSTTENNNQIKEDKDSSTASDENQNSGNNIKSTNMGANLTIDQVGYKEKEIDTNIVENSFFIDPINGKDENNGSINSPWKSLQNVVDTGKIKTQKWNKLPYKKDSSYLVDINLDGIISPGDTIYLKNGNHGDLFIQDFHNKSPIIIKSYPGHTAILNSIFIRSSSNWTIDGLKLIRKNDKKIKFIMLEDHSWRGPISDITIENSIISTSDNTKNWGKKDWDGANSGIDSDAHNLIVRNNYIYNIAFAIDSFGNNALIENNTIDMFSFDAFRLLGSNSTIRYNLVKNSIHTGNPNHDDFLQSWSRKGVPVVNNIIDSNMFISYENKDRDFQTKCQGIGLFDGPFINWKIINNVVFIEHWHGISAYKAKDFEIKNNTVIARDFDSDMIPGILLSSKDNNKGDYVSNNTITNNISSANAYTSKGVKVESNNIYDNLTGKSKVTKDIFLDYDNFDFRLK